MRAVSLLLCIASSVHISLQQVATSTIIVPPSTTVVVATTLTQYDPGVTVTVNSTAPASPQYTSPIDLRISVLNSTNFFRWEHNASFLAWNDSLAAYATRWAAQCQWAHSHGPPGENLARGYPDVVGAVDAWGNERSMYNFTLPTGFTEATGHFTQLVWKSTQTVGCAAYDCAGQNGVQGWFFVCEYWPAGNIVGQGSDIDAWFRVNVQSQIDNGQGYNLASATAGASGVGTSWATSGLPVATSMLSAAAPGGGELQWETHVIGGIIAFLGVFGL